MRWINTDRDFLPYLAKAMELNPTPNAVCIAEFDGTDPIAGAIFDGYNGRSIHSHIWIAPGRRVSRKFWFACYDYMFRVCGVQTVVGTVPSSNKAAQKLDEHLGYVLKSTIPNYYPNGDDMLLYVATPETAIHWQKFAPKGRTNGQQVESSAAA